MREGRFRWRLSVCSQCVSCDHYPYTSLYRGPSLTGSLCLLVTAGGQDQIPVQTCSLENLTEQPPPQLLTCDDWIHVVCVWAVFIFTVHNEVAKVMFLHVSPWGEYLGRYPPGKHTPQVAHLPRSTPPRKHTPGKHTPWQAHPPGKHPPGSTPPRMYTPPG